MIRLAEEIQAACKQHLQSILQQVQSNLLAYRYTSLSFNVDISKFDLPDDCPATYAWTDRVMAYDRAPDA